MAASRKCYAEKLHNIAKTQVVLQRCCKAQIAKTIFDKSRLYYSRFLEIFQNTSAFFYLIARISSNSQDIPIKTLLEKDILQIISGPVYKIIAASES